MQTPEVKVVSAGGLDFLDLLGVLFITLKLTHVISWSWWFVALPFYVAPAIAIAAALLAAVIVLLIAAVAGIVCLFRRK